MARRSLAEMVELTARVPRGHDGFWAIIKDLDTVGPWTLSQVDGGSNVDRASVKDYVLRLERGGYVGRVGTKPSKDGRSSVTLWRLLKKPVDAPRLDRAGNELHEPVAQLLWRSMRIMKTFSSAELRAAAELPGRDVTLVRTRQFINALSRVGVVFQVPGHKDLYVLARDLGPKAPSVGKTWVVFDRNSRQVIGTPTLEVEP